MQMSHNLTLLRCPREAPCVRLLPNPLLCLSAPAGGLFQTFPLSRLLKASMQLSKQALCNLAVKGSSLNSWNVVVS